MRADSPSPSHGILARAALPCVLLCLASPHAVHAQQVTFTGVVVDFTSGAPIPAALVTVGTPVRQAITDAQGRFQIADLPAGTQPVRVQRFGYRTLEQNVTLSQGMRLLQLQLEPDPIQLQQLTVSGNARADVTGVVRNALSGEPIPFTDLTLTRDAVQQVGRKEASDDRGEFEISDIQAGAYLLRVERLGYTSQYVPVSHVVPPLPIEVRLEPDSALIRGIALMTEQLTARRAAHARPAGTIGETDLRISPSTGMRQFFDGFGGGSISLIQCVPREPKRNCVMRRGEPVPVTVYIDGVKAIDPGLDQLDSYVPSDFHSIEHFECQGSVFQRSRAASALSGRVTELPFIEMHAYTYQYVERLGRAPRIPLPQCSG